MSTLASKILITGILAALGGFGLVAGPAVGGGLPSFADEPSEEAAPRMMAVAEAIEHESSEHEPSEHESSEPESSEPESSEPESSEPESSEPASGPARGARELAHERRDAVRELARPGDAPREAELDRPEPGQGGRGLGAEQRRAARAMRVARREALHALNAAHREAVLQLAERDRDDDSAPDHGRRRPRRAPHGR